MGRMGGSRQVAGGGREVRVAPERLGRWRDGFAERHGVTSVLEDVTGFGAVVLVGADRATATVEVPFPPAAAPGWEGLLAHALAPRRLGLLLVRLGGFAVGVADGESLLAAKTGSRQVHGRAAAGGWSQHRFARRREGQVRVALAAAADVTAAVVLPHVAGLAGLVTGGDRGAVATVLGDRRLAPLRALVMPNLLEVGEPRRADLEAAPGLARRVRVVVRDPVS